MSRSFLEALEAIIQASGGDAAAGALHAQVFAALERSGMPDETYLPAYFLDGFRALAAQQTAGWTDVDDAELGLSWVLRDLAPFLPGAVFRRQRGRDELVVPALGLALAVETSRTKDRWAIVAAPAHAAPPAEPPAEPRSFGTLFPTAAQLEQWARDPNLQLIADDELVALFYSEAHLGLLARLAAAPATLAEKRRGLLAALDEIIFRALWRQGGAGLARLDEALAQLPQEDGDLPAETRAWRADALDLRGALVRRGPLSLDRARHLAQQLLQGRRRPGAAVVEGTCGPWWHFASSVSGAPPREHLYLHPGTGALRCAAAPLTEEELAAPSA